MFFYPILLFSGFLISVLDAAPAKKNTPHSDCGPEAIKNGGKSAFHNLLAELGKTPNDLKTMSKYEIIGLLGEVAAKYENQERSRPRGNQTTEEWKRMVWDEQEAIKQNLSRLQNDVIKLGFESNLRVVREVTKSLLEGRIQKYASKPSRYHPEDEDSYDPNDQEAYRYDLKEAGHANVHVLDDNNTVPNHPFVRNAVNDFFANYARLNATGQQAYLDKKIPRKTYKAFAADQPNFLYLLGLFTNVDSCIFFRILVTNSDYLKENKQIERKDDDDDQETILTTTVPLTAAPTTTTTTTTTTSCVKEMGHLRCGDDD